jgi:hypothetical protein
VVSGRARAEILAADQSCLVSVAAATQILDRAYGRPIQSIDTTITENEHIRYVEVPRKSASAEAWLNEVGRPMIDVVAGAADDERKH